MHEADSIERAFQLVKSGKYESIRQILNQLTREGYDASRVSGRTLLAQLNHLIANRDDQWSAYLEAKARSSG
jgi:Holliday junction resolvase